MNESPLRPRLFCLSTQPEIQSSQITEAQLASLPSLGLYRVRELVPHPTFTAQEGGIHMPDQFLSANKNSWDACLTLGMNYCLHSFRP